MKRLALADELKREAKKFETVKTAELEWTDRVKLDHLILYLKEKSKMLLMRFEPMIFSSKHF